MNGWVDLDTLAAGLRIPRTTLRDAARREGWTTARPAGVICYHYRQVRPFALDWHARRKAA